MDQLEGIHIWLVIENIIFKETNYLTYAAIIVLPFISSLCFTVHGPFKLIPAKQKPPKQMKKKKNQVTNDQNIYITPQFVNL